MPAPTPSRTRLHPALRLLCAPLAAALILLLSHAPPLAAAPADPTTRPPRSGSISSALRDAWNWFDEGGPVMYPIALCSLVGVAFVIERAFALRRETVLPDRLRKDLLARLDARDVPGALAACEAAPCPLARVLQAGLNRHLGTAQEMEKAAEDAGVRELWLLRRNVRFIGVVAAIAPLLGLLGTVTGMVRAFNIISQSQIAQADRFRMFAGSIHEALYTTVLGLCVAIPMLLCHFWLYGKADALIAEIEEVAGGLLYSLARPGAGQDTPRPPEAH